MNEIEMRMQLIEMFTQETNERGNLNTADVIEIMRNFIMTNNLYPGDVIRMMSKFCDERLELSNGFVCAHGQNMPFEFDENYLMKNLERVQMSEPEPKQLSHNEKEEI